MEFLTNHFLTNAVRLTTFFQNQNRTKNIRVPPFDIYKKFYLILRNNTPLRYYFSQKTKIEKNLNQS